MDYRPRLNLEEYNLLRSKGNRVLVIGDIHAPFELKEYLPFCKSIYDKYNCNKVVFIGDIIDNHFSSFHDTDPDGHSAGKELDRAVKSISKWYKVFKEADVCLGNHDLIPNRKAFNAGLSNRWVKTLGEVLNVPKWNFQEDFVIDNVRYTHGTGKKARQRARGELFSVVQGHYHSESYIEHYVGSRFKIFAMQVGCGIDKDSYSMAYGKNFAKPQINCGVVLENGTLPILEYMKL